MIINLKEDTNDDDRFKLMITSLHMTIYKIKKTLMMIKDNNIMW